MLTRLALAAALALPVAAFAADPAATPAKKEPTAQQQKMGVCNKEAGAKKLEGEARKKFMSECLSASAPAAEPKKELTPQQEKMGACNKEAAAKNLKGDERKTFMSECLKK